MTYDITSRNEFAVRQPKVSSYGLVFAKRNEDDLLLLKIPL